MQNNIINVLTEAQQKELKEYDAIFNDSLNPTLGMEPSAEAIEEVARKFGGAADELGKCAIVVNEEMRQCLIALGLSLKNFDVLVMEHFSDKTSPKDLANELSSLVPEKTCGYNTGRKGKGERKRASRNQRQQWRR